jgi:hypothetical protein
MAKIAETDRQTTMTDALNRQTTFGFDALEKKRGRDS